MGRLGRAGGDVAQDVKWGEVGSGGSEEFPPTPSTITTATQAMPGLRKPRDLDRGRRGPGKPLSKRDYFQSFAASLASTCR